VCVLVEGGAKVVLDIIHKCLKRGVKVFLTISCINVIIEYFICVECNNVYAYHMTKFDMH